MKFTLTSYSLVFFVVLLSVVANHQVSAYNKAKWMEEMAVKIADKPLNMVAIPGTHDSGTSEISPSRPLSPEAPSFVTDLWAKRDEIEAQVPAAVRPIINAVFGVVDDIIQIFVAPWAKTQYHNVATQLNDGIRSIDIRTCAKSDGSLSTCHAQYGESIASVLNGVKSFVIANPKEVVIASFVNFAFCQLTPGNVEDLYNQIVASWGPHLIPYNSFSPNSTLNEIWYSRGGNGGIVVFFQDTPTVTQDSRLWPSSQLQGSWDGNVGPYVSEKIPSMEAYLNSRPYDKFFDLTGAMTATTEMEFSGIEATLLKLIPKPATCPPEAPSNEGGLCYKYCNAGYTGVGPLCWKGLLAYSRGVGIIPTYCGVGYQNVLGVCFPGDIFAPDVNNPNSLEALAMQINPVIAYKLQNEWKDKNNNIVSGDFYQISSMVDVVLSLNE